MLIPRRSCVLTALTLLSPPSLDVPIVPSITTTSNDAVLLGGFLLPESAYEAYVTDLAQGVDGFNTRVYAYNDPLLLGRQDSLIGPDTQLLAGHSKGAKTAAAWMASGSRKTRPIPTVLIEPVDVDPPGNQQGHFCVLDLWKENQDVIASTPTLIISAPFTETSKRYGKAGNLCAPEGKDARAFFEAASQARRAASVVVAPLAFAEFPLLGHNDVTSAALGGCADGPGRKTGSQAVALLVSRWIAAIRRQEDVALALQSQSLDNIDFRIYGA
jgi:hypothetical protein